MAMMDQMKVSLSFLADLPVYETEKPYYALLSPDDEPPYPTNNLDFVTRDNIPISNLRGNEANFSVEQQGFEILRHISTESMDLNTPESMERYKRETEAMLQNRFNADFTLCFEARLRKNLPWTGRLVYDLRDPLLVEGPALGAHTDFTVDSGPRTIHHYMSKEAKQTYLSKPGYRFRIFNTWRSLIPQLEDNPLAVCDARTVDLIDLIAADRIIPTRVGELYYVKYSPNHHWYWLENMNPDEPFLMAMYDSDSGDDAKFCPHISFQNPLASKDAVARYSIETRSIVITNKRSEGHK